jgi:hypothetical protein
MPSPGRTAYLTRTHPAVSRAAREMGFNWLYVNPFRDPGFPGSLYAVKDYACRQGRFGLDLLRWCYL